MTDKLRLCLLLTIGYAYKLARKPATWILLILLARFLFWREDALKTEISQLEEASEEIIVEAEIEAVFAARKKMIAELGAPERIAQSPDDFDLEFMFPPSLCEAITTQFFAELKRMPTNWTDIRASLSASKIPPPSSGYKYVYNARYGVIEQLRDK